jgi:putative transposase
LMSLGYRLKRTKNYRVTTRRGPWYYPNLIEGLKVNRGSEVWQSDITYIRVGDRFYYAVFIIDVYTKKVVGYSVSDHMRSTANIRALKMALRDHDPPKIHHSDRGSQYIHEGYINHLKKLGVKLSMGKIAQENAYAERINGTIKNEFLKHWKPQSFDQLKTMIKKAVNYYNQVRPHDSLDKKSPENFIKQLLKTETKEGRSMTIFDYQNQ